MTEFSQTEVFGLFDLMGTAAFALSGFLMAVRARLDLMGMFVLAMLSATGGGALGDLMLGRAPGVLARPWAFAVVGGVVALAFALNLHRRNRIEVHPIFVLTDTIGLAAFAVLGAQKALAAEQGVIATMAIAAMAALGGGLIRDVLVNRVPSVLHSDVLASIALLTGALVWGSDAIGLPQTLSAPGIFVLAIVLRYLGRRYSWKLPRLEPDHPLTEQQQTRVDQSERDIG